MRSAVDLAAALRRRELSAVEALEDALACADAIPAAFALRLDGRARAAALVADGALARGDGGPLCGVPVSVKDSQWMAGVPTTFASRAVEPLIPVETVAAVRRLEEAGAVVFAKTATPEFCYAGVTPELGNPHDDARTAGGSSGGAAVAVASGAGALALGGDGGGSIRIPAAFCGVVGFKPTFGAVPREPSGAGWKTLVAYGPLARSAADARLMFSCLAGRDPLDRHSLDVDLGTAPPRFAACDSLGGIDEDVRAVFRAVVEELGAVWDRPDVEPSGATWATIATAEARWSEAEPFEQRPALLGDSARAFLAAGDAVTTDVYIRAQVQRERIHRAYADLFARSGLLLTPTVGCEAFSRDLIGPEGIPDWGAFLFDANLAGLPACAIPMGVGDEGLPISLQITGPRGADGAVLAAAEHIEELLILRGTGGQRARDRTVGAELPVRQLLRLLRRHPPADLRPGVAALPRVQLDRGHQQLPALAQGGARPDRRPRRAGVVRVPRRGDREAVRRRRAEGRAALRGPAPPAGLQDRHHAARQRGWCPVRAEPARPRVLVRRTAGARVRARGRSGGPDAVRRLRQDHVLPPRRARLERLREAAGRRRAEGHERINCRAAAVEAVITRHGTVVGPVMRDLTGHPELTPYRGWCGNDIFLDALSAEHRERARHLTEQLGDRLAVEGYRGFFEVDYLVDVDTGELYLGELNPRLSGVTSMTSVSAGAYADMPLVLLHLAEYLDLEYELDVAEINDRWARTAALDEWSQLVIKETREDVELLTAAPRTGVWRLDSAGGAVFAGSGNDWHSICDEGEAFYLQVLGAGEYRYPGADLGLLVARSRMQTSENELTPRALEWIEAIRGQFAGVPLEPTEVASRPHDALAFKA